MDGNNIAGMNIVKLCASASSIADDCLRLPHFIVSTNIRIFFLEIVEISLFHASNRNIWSFLSSNTLQQDRKYIYNMINFPWQLCLVEVFVAVFGASFYSLFPEEIRWNSWAKSEKKWQVTNPPIDPIREAVVMSLGGGALVGWFPPPREWPVKRWGPTLGWGQKTPSDLLEALKMANPWYIYIYIYKHIYIYGRFRVHWSEFDTLEVDIMAFALLNIFAPWKMMVGRRSFPLAVSCREGNNSTYRGYFTRVSQLFSATYRGKKL